MPYSDNAKEEMLDGLTVNQLSLHNGDPGVDGTANEISGGSPAYARQAATFGSASGGTRSLSSDVSFDGPADQSVTHIGVWNSSGSVFQGGFEITSGDTSFNASGQFTVTTDTDLTISDAA